MNESLCAKYKKPKTDTELEQDSEQVRRQAKPAQKHLFVRFGTMSVLDQFFRCSQRQHNVDEVRQYQCKAERTANVARPVRDKHCSSGKREGKQEKIEVAHKATSFRPNMSGRSPAAQNGQRHQKSRQCRQHQRGTEYGPYANFLIDADVRRAGEKCEKGNHRLRKCGPDGSEDGACHTLGNLEFLSKMLKRVGKKFGCRENDKEHHDQLDDEISHDVAPSRSDS